MQSHTNFTALVILFGVFYITLYVNDVIYGLFSSVLCLNYNDIYSNCSQSSCKVSILCIYISYIGCFLKDQCLPSPSPQVISFVFYCHILYRQILLTKGLLTIVQWLTTFTICIVQYFAWHYYGTYSYCISCFQFAQLRLCYSVCLWNKS